MVRAPGFEPVAISGTQILAETIALQPVRMTPIVDEVSPDVPVVIPDHTLYGDYPPKIAESEVKPVAETGEIVLSRVVIPQTIIVHDGVPTDPTAPNYYVPYGDYIKNVASSEIYATWPRETIIANVLAIMSFTLNRVYTEWYRNQGYDFTITSSTAFDHKWIRERNIYESISEVVDEIFNSYLSRPGIRQPILTQYCDGQRVRCPNWMSQWGSNTLGEQGYTAIQILRNYYGSDMYINTAEQVSGVPSSFPGYNLTIGATGEKVQQVQEQLAVIAGVYTAIPRITADGTFGEQTAEAVRQFQKIFKLPVTGVIDFATWYRISHIYVGITRIAEYS
jgi:peptidoglycan hydrolase-like protein with peptidoglycan-binding domain